VEEINKIRKVSIWIFLVPIFVLNLCLLISINYTIFDLPVTNFWSILKVDQVSRSGFTIPYIDGSLSISRTARGYPNYIFFKAGMIITSILLIRYWIANNLVIKKFNKNSKKNKYFLVFGVCSAIFLATHSIFLGFDFDINLYKFFRRFVLLGFIVFEIIAQALLVLCLIDIKDKTFKYVNSKILSIKMVLVSVLIIVALLSLPILNSNEYTHFKHALEWNYFLGIVTFYLLTFLFWKKIKTPVHAPESA